MNLDELIKGQKVSVIKSFKDFDGQMIKEGSTWTFDRFSYFAYDGGYTFYFNEGIIRMAEISPDDYYVFEHASEFFVLIP